MRREVAERACTVAGVALYRRLVVSVTANSGGNMKTSRISRALLACAVFVGGAIAVIGTSTATAAGPKLDNGIGTPAALANPNCDPQTKQIKILLIARAPA